MQNAHNNTDDIASVEKTYWIQGRRSLHWHNVERLASAADALIATADCAKSPQYDEVRLFEARFFSGRGKTDFIHLATLTKDGAEFGSDARNGALSHTRMDLIGSSAPLTDPHTGNAPAPLTAPPPRTTGTQAPALPPRRKAAKPSGRRRTALLTGVMAASFAVGAMVSATAPPPLVTAVADAIGKISGYQDVRTVSLHGAIADRDVSLVRQMLSAGADPNQRDAEGTPALLAAARDGLPMTVDLLFNAGADPHLKIDETRTIMQAMVAEGLSGPARFLLDAAVTPNIASNAPPAVGFILAAPDPVDAAGVAREVAELSIRDLETDPAPVNEKTAIPAPIADLDAQADSAAGFSEPAHYAALETDTPGLPRPPKREETLTLLADAEQAATRTAFTTAAPGIAMNAVEEQTHPRAPRKPVALIKRDWFKDAVAETIETGSVRQLAALLGNRPETVDLASLVVDVDSIEGIGGRTLLDYALLQGRPKQAEMLYAQGVRLSPDVLPVLITALEPAAQRAIAPVLPKLGVDMDRRQNGKTALMRAAEAGRGDIALPLLHLGADASLKTAEGHRAADLAAAAGHTPLLEPLVTAADKDLYAPMMFGLSWHDTLDSVRAEAKTCKEVGDGYVACSLNVQSFLPDTAAVVAQFDTRNGNRLVAIQIDSILFGDEGAATDSFSRAATVVSNTVPGEQFGFLVQNVPGGSSLFESLSSSEGAGEYFQYWPDQNLSRSVYVHMKMIGYQGDKGFHRTVIGNPFRIG